MRERLVILRTQDGLSFVADACSALAGAVNEIRPGGDVDLVSVYAEMVAAYARLLRPRLVANDEAVRVAIVDHLLGRLAEARAGVRAVPVADIVDGLHGELVRQDALG